MRAWQFDQFGHYNDVLHINENAPDPKPKPGYATIKVLAAGVNFYDTLLIAGKYQEKPPLPAIPGGEVVGEVIEVGPDCSLKVGQRVMTSAVGGGFCEYSLAPCEFAFSMPEKMTDAEGAAFLVNYQTSYYALKPRGQLAAGETLLVHGAAGGVGLTAVQLGKAMGATVIATAGSDDKLEICKANGADYLINYSEDDFVEKVKEITKGKGADVIYDPVGGDVFDASTKCIALYGRILVIGFAQGRIPTIAINRILLKNMSVVGVYWGANRTVNPPLIGSMQEDLYKLYNEGKIKPVVYKEYPLEGFPKALAELEGRVSYSKIVIKP